MTGPSRTKSRYTRARHILYLTTCLLLVTASIGPQIAVATAPTNSTSQAHPLTTNVTIESPNESRTRSVLQSEFSPAQAPGDRRTVVVELHPNGTDHLPELKRAGAEIQLHQARHVQATLPATAIPRVASLPWVKSVRHPQQVTAFEISEGVAAIDAHRVHERNVTGQGVKVGVIDIGFNPSNPEIADNVADTKTFTGDITNGGATDHGTAVSEIVVDTAPNASLYLANVGTEVEFAAAVDWLIEQDVDVISVSLGWLIAPHDGTHLSAQKATEAANEGIVYVSASGNYAQRHWEGQYTDPDGDGWLNVDGNLEANHLNDGQAFTGTVDINLMWNGWSGTSSDYDLYLFRDTPGGDDPIVDFSTLDQPPGSTTPYENIRVRLTTLDEYYVGIHRRSGSGDTSIELFTANNDLLVQTESGSVAAPATAKNITSAAAFQYNTDSIESFSSRGPTNDGRQGVHVAGPDGVTTTALNPFSGTSASAPHVAGVAALVLDKNPDLTRPQVQRVLTGTAINMGPTGLDYRSGYGRVNASAAVASATPPISAESFTLSHTTRPVNASLTVNATVTNTGLIAGSESIALSVNGTESKTTSVTLEANESTTVSFEIAFDSPGVRSITVDGLPEQQVSIVKGASVRLSPASRTVIESTTTEFDLVVTDASAGVGSLDVSVRSNDSSVATLTAVEYLGTTSGFTAHWAADNSSVRLDDTDGGFDGGDQTTIATITVTSNTNGTAALDVTVQSLADSDGVTYTILHTNGSVLTVTAGDGDVVPASYEDSSGQVQNDGLARAANDWAANRLSTQTLIAVVQDWAAGSA